MRPDFFRLGILAAVALLAVPCSTLAQTTTSTDAAIAELRQLLADQRAALDRQARTIEEQGRHTGGIAAAGRRSKPEYRDAGRGCGTACSTTRAGKPHGC